MYCEDGAIKVLQWRPEAIEDENKENIKISSKFSSLNPYLDEIGIIRVEGRLEKSDINNECKHPMLMPKGCHISNWLFYGVIRKQDILVEVWL